MANTPQFFDHFVLANMSLQERLGRSGSALNKDSAVFGQQTRSLLQMLNFGNDAVTARAASHLLNMDLFYSNDAYLLKLTEGILLNSVESVTPPKVNASTPLRFWSERPYKRWSSLGSISLKDGSKVNLIAYDIHAIGKVEGSDKGTEYSALYCAGNYVQQQIDSGFDGYTPGVFAPIFISETYKAVWAESVEVRLVLGDGRKVPLTLVWSMDEMLALPDADRAALVQNTPRGMTLTLGDGEIFGKGYNDKSGIVSVVITYVKCDSLAPVDHSTIKFNKDVSLLYGDVPLLTPLKVGDTAVTLRSRAIAEFFAASKITDERDLNTEVLKIPFVKSCGVRREYNWPVWTTIKLLADVNTALKEKNNSIDSGALVFYNRYLFTPYKQYTPGEMVLWSDTLWVCIYKNPTGYPDAEVGWARFMSLSDGAAISTLYTKYYPSACVYDNATIVLSGLVLKNRRYWNADSHYSRGDVVYHSGTKELWLALRDGGETVEPGSEDVGVNGDEATGVYRFWATREEASMLEDEYAQSVNNAYVDLRNKFDDYEQLTQAIFESEIKGYFNIAGKLGFTSVVVEPLVTIGVTVKCQYNAPYTMQQSVRDYIEDYVCYHVNENLRADELNSTLTEKFNLSAVYIQIRLNVENSQFADAVQLPVATYVPPSLLEIDLVERL